MSVTLPYKYLQYIEILLTVIDCHYLRDEDNYVQAYQAVMKPGEVFKVPLGLKGDFNDGNNTF